MSRERCLYTVARASIWEAAEETSSPVGRAGLGPARSTWFASDFQPSDLIRINSATEECSDEVDPHACAWGWARAHAERGDAEKAARMCAAVRTTAPNPNRWRHFCFLSAAEAHVSHWERARFTDSVRLCGAAGPFRAMCADGLIDSVATLAPSSDSGDERVWVEHILRANSVQQAWSDSSFLMEIMDRFWAVSMRASIEKSKGLSGDAMGHIPPVALPHLRAALAWAVVSRWEGTPDFAAVRETVMQALGARLELSTESTSRVHLPPVADHWSVDREGEAHLSAVSYFGDSRRTLAMDPEMDVGLCVLEAFARTSPPLITEIEKASSVADERLKWTVARLLEQLREGQPHHPDRKGQPVPVVPTSDL